MGRKSLQTAEGRVEAEVTAENRDIAWDTRKAHPYFTKFRKCAHSTRMTHRRRRGFKVLDIESEGFQDLFKLLTDKKLCKSMAKLCASLTVVNKAIR